MRSTIGLAIICLSIAACNSKENAPGNNSAASNPATAPSPATAAVKSKIDPCSLLTSDEIKTVQGEAYTNAQRSDQANADFIVAQCYYALPIASNSVVLNLTTAKEAAGAANPRDFWETTFGQDEKTEQRGKASDKEKEKEKERAQKNKPGERREEGEEEAAKPDKVAGLGDEAFWTASRVGGALYVLKKDKFFRISIGGAGDQETKLKKSKTLAQDVLKKLS